PKTRDRSDRPFAFTGDEFAKGGFIHQRVTERSRSQAELEGVLKFKKKIEPLRRRGRGVEQEKNAYKEPRRSETSGSHLVLLLIPFLASWVPHKNYLLFSPFFSASSASQRFKSLFE